MAAALLKAAIGGPLRCFGGADSSRNVPMRTQGRRIPLEATLGQPPWKIVISPRKFDGRPPLPKHSWRAPHGFWLSPPRSTHQSQNACPRAGAIGRAVSGRGRGLRLRLGRSLVQHGCQRQRRQEAVGTGRIRPDGPRLAEALAVLASACANPAETGGPAAILALAKYSVVHARLGLKTRGRPESSMVKQSASEERRASEAPASGNTAPISLRAEEHRFAPAATSGRSRGLRS
jgi:hypothetical protein